MEQIEARTTRLPLSAPLWLAWMLAGMLSAVFLSILLKQALILGIAVSAGIVGGPQWALLRLRVLSAWRWPLGTILGLVVAPVAAIIGSTFGSILWDPHHTHSEWPINLIMGASAGCMVGFCQYLVLSWGHPGFWRPNRAFAYWLAANTLGGAAVTPALYAVASDLVSQAVGRIPIDRSGHILTYSAIGGAAYGLLTGVAITYLIAARVKIAPHASREQAIEG